MLAEERQSMPVTRRTHPHPDDPFMAPVDVSKLPDLFAMKALGRCMEPQIVDGTLLVFDKLAPCRAGDTVVIFKTAASLKRGEFPGVIKTLVSPMMRGDRFVFGKMLNPPSILSFPVDHVAAVYRCLGPAAEAGGKVSIAAHVIAAARAS